MIFNPVGNRIGKIDLPARCASIREFCAGPGWLSRHSAPVFRDVADLKLRVERDRADGGQPDAEALAALELEVPPPESSALAK